MKCNLILHKLGFAAHCAWSRQRGPCRNSTAGGTQELRPVWDTQPRSACLMEGLLIPSLWMDQQLWRTDPAPFTHQKLPAEALQPGGRQATQTHTALPFCLCPRVWERSPPHQLQELSTPPRPWNCSHLTPRFKLIQQSKTLHLGGHSSCLLSSGSINYLCSFPQAVIAYNLISVFPIYPFINPCSLQCWQVYGFGQFSFPLLLLLLCDLFSSQRPETPTSGSTRLH